MQGARSVIVALLVAAVPGCMQGVPEDAQAVALSRIPEARWFLYDSGMATARRRVIRDQGHWESRWLEMVGSLRPIPPTPAVDFANHVVIVVAMGTRPTGGYAIDIEAVHAMDDDVWVSVRQTSPGPSCVVATANSAPVDVAVVPRFGGDATFLEEESEHDCRAGAALQIE